MTLLYFFIYFFNYIKQRCEPSSKLRPPLTRADRPLLRVRGRTLSVYADMLTMNIQISLKFHAVCAASKVLQNYNDLGMKGVYNILRYCTFLLYTFLNEQKVGMLQKRTDTRGVEISNI